MKEIINLTEEFAREKVAGFDESHDWWHLLRVRNIALFINAYESTSDSFTLEIRLLK